MARFPFAFQLVFIIILYATVPWLPESPRWLIVHEYEDIAFTILALRLQVVLWKILTTITEPSHYSLYSEIRKPLRVNAPKLTCKRRLRKCGGTAVLTQLSSDEAAASAFQGKFRKRPSLRTRLRLDLMSCGTRRRCDTLSVRTYPSLVTEYTSS